jgi:hypothetical protein
MTEVLLLPFNGRLNLRNAYNWNQSQVSFFLIHASSIPKWLLKIEIKVYNFLQDVINNSDDYGVLADRVARLRNIKRDLLRLR